MTEGSIQHKISTEGAITFSRSRKASDVSVAFGEATLGSQLDMLLSCAMDTPTTDRAVADVDTVPARDPDHSAYRTGDLVKIVGIVVLIPTLSIIILY